MGVTIIGSQIAMQQGVFTINKNQINGAIDKIAEQVEANITTYYDKVYYLCKLCYLCYFTFFIIVLYIS